MKNATLTIVFEGRHHTLDYVAGDTVLEAARRAGLSPPFSCEAGNCATCMALLHRGHVTMRANNALTPDDLDEGWILTCQSIPEGDTVVEYENY
ncbi:2Fe-2S iron-sulfur cluster-binding protein [Candidatus Poriferisocius sp.]|uniref:2Fe-2S iron-sulfur cluster-binding protein n=1 Tax=Candidatus Poriferisocius sp. TaxID=3101276 RepID=UPI003B01F554